MLRKRGSTVSNGKEKTPARVWERGGAGDTPDIRSRVREHVNIFCRRCVQLQGVSDGGDSGLYFSGAVNVSKGVKFLKRLLLCKTRLFRWSCLLYVLCANIGYAEVAAVTQRIKSSPVLEILYGDWDVSETLIPEVYALYPPSGRFAPAFFDSVSGSVGSIRGWQKVTASGLQAITRDEGQAMRRRLLASFDWAQGIKSVYGKGAGRAIFISAFDCPTCQRFEQRLAKQGTELNAVLYLFPQTLHPNEAHKADLVRNIWCGANPHAAWLGLLSGKLPPRVIDGRCVGSNRLATELSDMLGVRGVPALLTADGRILQGFVNVPMATLGAALRP